MEIQTRTHLLINKENQLRQMFGVFGKKQGLGMRSFQKNATFLPSFAFFSKERNVFAFFCILYKKNTAFFAFFYVLFKRMLHSLRSFTFFIKERGVLCIPLCYL